MSEHIARKKVLSRLKPSFFATWYLLRRKYKSTKDVLLRCESDIIRLQKCPVVVVSFISNISRFFFLLFFFLIWSVLSADYKKVALVITFGDERVEVLHISNQSSEIGQKVSASRNHPRDFYRFSQKVSVFRSNCA